MSTKVKAKIIQNIEFDGDYNTISIIKKLKNNVLIFMMKPAMIIILVFQIPN